MKQLIFTILTLFTIQAGAECPDLSGSFRGLCTSTESDGKVHQYDLQYDITQTKCERIEIKVIAYPDQWYVMEIYDLVQGLVQFDGDENIKIMSGGHFLDDSFAGTLIYHNVDEGSVDTVYNQYRKVSKNSISHLLLDQTSHGARMICDLPHINM